jgi:hypothetical protein
MVKESIKSRKGYGIPYLSNICGSEKLAVIISHGLGSSKESPTALALMERLCLYGVGGISYDFPGHGESPVSGNEFLIENCINDLAAVESHVRSLLPEAEIVYFSSSFGAYINLIYLAKTTPEGKKAFLRSAAVDLPRVFKDNETPEILAELEERGYFLLGDDCFRPLRITKEFCDELGNNDVFTFDRLGGFSMSMVHGSEDETVPLEHVKRFSNKFNAVLKVVEDGNHRLMGPGHMDLVLSTALDFFIS